MGSIVEAEVFKEARKPAYQLKIDLAPKLGIRKSSAQITDLYEIDELLGKQVLCVANFPQKQIGPYMSDRNLPVEELFEDRAKLEGADGTVNLHPGYNTVLPPRDGCTFMNHNALN